MTALLEAISKNTSTATRRNATQELSERQTAVDEMRKDATACELELR